MRIRLLFVPGCPGMPLLDRRLARAVSGRRDVRNDRQVITDERQAVAAGMTGSPTMLVEGRDPFGQPRPLPGLSCRLYRTEEDRLDSAPSVAQLRLVLSPYW